ncbi:uncharacterized protein LOC62_05G007709 [Vanrija pseudolonga]|uniref:Uncharacterized protein n=1 Tax=Vanrija pseudolonga TaxID=143232 RepID=A0AAF0YHR9_9TREE|nr:hypothetical protein LOC62_05G007709 [Vanrija pseudolonga]
MPEAGTRDATYRGGVRVGVLGNDAARHSTRTMPAANSLPAPKNAAGLLAALNPKHALSTSDAAAIIRAYAEHKLRRRRPSTLAQLTHKLDVLEPRTCPSHKPAFAAVRAELHLPAWTAVCTTKKRQVMGIAAPELAYVSYVGGATEHETARQEWVELSFDSSEED